MLVTKQGSETFKSDFDTAPCLSVANMVAFYLHIYTAARQSILH